MKLALPKCLVFKDFACLMIAFLLAWCTALPLALKFLYAQLNDENYQFSLPYLAFLAWLGWKRIQPISNSPFHLGLPHLVIFLAAWVVLALAIILEIPKVGFLGWAILSLLGVAIFLPRATLIRLLPVFAASLLVIPPPFALLEKLTSTLQGQVVWVAHNTLMATQILHTVTGNVILLVDRPLLVAEACSGIRSLVSIIALSICFSLYKAHSWPRSVLLLLISVVVVLFVNLFRILFIVLMIANYKLDFTMGLKHEILGIACFIMGLVVIAGTDGIIDTIKGWITGVPAGAPSAEDAIEDSQPASLQQCWATWMATRLGAFGWVLALLFVPLLAIQVKILATQGVDFISTTGNVGHLPLIAQGNQLTEIAGWKMVKGPEISSDERILGQGVQSQFWEFEKIGLRARISIDEPFRGFHDLAFCYRNVGWDQKTPNTPINPGGKYAIAAVFFRAPNIHLHLWFGHLDTNGRWIEPRTSLGNYWDYIKEKLARNMLGKSLGTSDLNFQLQLSCASTQELSTDQKNELLELFEGFRSRMEGFPEIQALGK